MIIRPQVLPIEETKKQLTQSVICILMVTITFVAIAYTIIQLSSKEDKFDGLLLTQTSEIKLVSIYKYKATKETALVFSITTTFGEVILILDNVEYNKLKLAIEGALR